MMMMTLTSLLGAGCDKHESANASAPQPQSNVADVDKAKVAIFAGGCFWCIDGVYRQLKGVLEVTSGYAGGTKDTANYETVCTGATGHAEAVRIKYDPDKITYGDLLRVFFSVHDPTTLNRQGGDEGTQYRSAIFYLDDAQKAQAQSYIQQLNQAKVFPDPIVTSLEPITLDTFYPAEAYHQNYFVCNVHKNPYLLIHALPMVQKVRSEFKELVKPGTTDPS
jgi:peptide-methionine (S)-S-oxide reductase